MKYTKEEILRMIDEEDVEFIRLQFTDMFGSLKNIAITVSQLEKAMDNKCMFDGSSIDGFARIEESDMYLYPDFDTFTIFPWRPQQGKVARFICDVYRPDGKEFECDARNILKNVISEAGKMGYKFEVGPECEFFLFHTDDYGNPTTCSHEKAGYFDVGPMDLGENARRDMVLSLEDMGFEIEQSHHEISPAQHEIDFKYDDALKTADNIMTFKMAVKSIAKRHGLYATFMPKPKSGTDGSGMHINMSLKKDGKNIFFDEKDKNGLSKEAYSFMAGIMNHISAMTAVSNPLINSYKRLVPGYDAPVDIAWSKTNRCQLLRIPSSGGENTRIELRCPDPTANPYLLFALCLAAGLDGIKNNMEVPEEIDKTLCNMSPEERKAAGIKTLPDNLYDAICIFEKDEFIKSVLGETLVERYANAKKSEWQSYRTQVTKWEIDNYLHRY